MKPLPETATFAEFARIAGYRSRSYVTQLNKEGKLVLKGRRILVAKTLALINDTCDPAKRGVAERHAAERRAKEKADAATNDAPPPVESTEDEPDDVPVFEGSYHHWRARNERAKTLAAERENLVAEGRLLDATDVSHAVAGGVTTLRARLEALPSMLAPQLAGMDDESAIRVAMAEAIEHALTECARSLQALGAEASA